MEESISGSGTSLTTAFASPLAFAIADLKPVEQLPAFVQHTTTGKLFAEIADAAHDAQRQSSQTARDLMLPAVITAVMGSSIVGGSIAAAGLGNASILGGGLFAALCILGVWPAVSALADRALQRKTGSALKRVELAADTMPGLERAWVARHAIDIYESIAARPGDATSQRLFPGLAQMSFMKRMRDMGRVLDQALPEELAMANELISIHKLAFGPFDREGANDKSADDNLEKIIAHLESLSPAARVIARSTVQEHVLAVLDNDPGNGWRRTRFLEALDGQRTPYSTKLPEPSAQVFSLDVVGRDKPAARVTYARITDAVDALGAALRRGSTAAVTLVNVESARLTAAYFEAKGMRASLYERHGVTCVGVFDPAQPPTGPWLKTAIARPEARKAAVG